VGIGTASPASRLSVAGNTNITGELDVDSGGAGNGTISGNLLRFGGIGGAYGEAILSKRNAGGNQFGLDLFTASLPRLSITNLGNVGIGTQAPSHTLTVQSPGTSTLRLINSGGGTYGQTAKLNFGDGDYAYIQEDVDDKLTIHAAGRIAMDNQVTLGTLAPNGGDRLTVAGNCSIAGSMTASTKFFKIDHPLDPENRYLQHSCIESSDIKNLYDGVVTTDGAGNACIDLPDWFSALNRDFRYQLTVVDPTMFALIRVSREIENNRFCIASNVPNVKVSWQVTGIRQDAYAAANPQARRQDKPESARGKYLFPEAFGQPANKGENYQPPAPAAAKEALR